VLAQRTRNKSQETNPEDKLVMKIFTLASILTALVLAGCGGSDSLTRIRPEPTFKWQVLEAGSFAGDQQARETVFRSEDELQKALPGRKMPVDWSTSMVAYLSLGEASDARHQIKILEVRREAKTIVVVFRVEESQVAPQIICTPGAVVELSHLNLPVRFEKYGADPGAK
jgi:hypothetical protein